MGEGLDQNPEHVERFDREQALADLVENYFPEDAEFLGEMDFDDRLGAVYGQLLELGEDPDAVLTEAGVLEDEDEI
ncbi:MAG TPA: hypothetical protein VFL81_02680 [Candidatus Saccharimonadales bacterium]|nr:hypothetical protein [Candidatus Saccharimonadales bacterium]